MHPTVVMLLTFVPYIAIGIFGSNYQKAHDLPYWHFLVIALSSSILGVLVRYVVGDDYGRVAEFILVSVIAITLHIKTRKE